MTCHFDMQLKENYIDFATEIKSRGIEHLIHFTPTINLFSIFERGGLLCRQSLESLDIAETDLFDYTEFTDEVRYDDKSYINLSISFPNSFLLLRFMQRTISKPHVVWAIIKIDPKYIYRKDTLFSVTNAANRFNRTHYRITGDIGKFRMMFDQNISVETSAGKRHVTRLNSLSPKFPTDIQAEVLVKNWIPMKDILQVCFKTRTDLAATRAALSDYNTSNFVVEEKLFLNQRV
jgi:hypothetical protein